jgi:multidrug efflux pump subunit AcrA (membrane-fusion protein)
MRQARTAEGSAVDVFTVSPSRAPHSLKLPGETAAWSETAIYARVNGYVTKWFVDIGDDVTAGQTSWLCWARISR